MPLIAGKSFSGYQVLAYYYVSWLKVFPEYLEQLLLPFGKEYEFALEMVGMGGGLSSVTLLVLIYRILFNQLL